MGSPVFRIISDEAGFKELKDSWNDLLEKSASDTVFLTWEWLYTWWECFGEGKRLFIIMAEEDSVLVGIAPLYQVRSRFFGLRSLSHLEFLGTTGVITEYPDFIVQAGRERDLVPAFLDFIFADDSDWGALNLVSMKQDAMNLNLIHDYCDRNNIGFGKYASNTCPFIELPASMEDYMKTLSNKSRWKFKDYRKKLEKGRAVEVRETPDEASVVGDFESIMQLHQKRWEQKGGPGSFAQSRVRFLEFHRRIIRRFFVNGWLYLLRLMVDGTPTAGHYSFFYHGTVYCHSVGFDPGWTEQNVGSVLQLLAIEESIRRGAKEFDFLRGAEQYKYYWTKKERACVDTVIWRSDRIERRVAIEQRLRRTAKKLLPKAMVEKVYRRIVNRD